MQPSIIRTKDRPELAQITAEWRWNAFMQDSIYTRADAVDFDVQSASSEDLIPTVLVLLEEQTPAGMVTLCLNDVEHRPDLNPWLAGLYVEPEFRGKGYGSRLVDELEALARSAGENRLYLYTPNAEGFYMKAGWETFETFEEQKRLNSIMRKDLDP
ncbi:GNAT family N-acetyltransferase [Labrenzia sp. PHM005]|uniref:GNAT family N-acetyltransferase n=1 Tax=Labrenzia sp. PHM005 TaxID=2590016 RepID=UPI001140314F|nr:GNAT family N-acetyltransferase [Labrenzia sp. PHM005]QDG75498.1 GNAT family N-acetyltransferase [Labrenzia sp. PHM005]